MPERSPRAAILDVLASARITSPFAPAEIADSILHALAIADGAAAAQASPVRAILPSKVIENLPYSIDVYDDGGNLVEVLGRLSLLGMAHAAFDEAAKQKADAIVTLRLKAQVIRESKRA